MIRIDDSGDVTKCWLSPDELGRLERAAGEDGWEREVALQLMGRCGLRASEVNYPSDEKLRYSEKGDLWLFGGSRKEYERRLKKRSETRGCLTVWPMTSTNSAESVISRRQTRGSTRVPSRRWVKEAAKRATTDADAARWNSVSSHDLRRSWATYHLVERQVDVRTVMSIGGWSGYSAIEPYLAEPTEMRIGEAIREKPGA
jgi:site-specific recombinase XerC